MKKRLQSTIWKYYAFSFLQSVTFFGAVLIPFYTQWGKISIFQVQILQSWFMFWGFLLEIPTGIIADRIGRKYSIALGSLLFGWGMIVYGSIPDFKIFLLGEFLAAVGVAFVSGAGQALLYDYLKENGREAESKKYLGRADAAKYAGMLISATSGSFIAAKLGLNAPFYLTAIPMFLAAAVALTINESKVIHEQPLGRKIFWEKTSLGFNFLKNNPKFRSIVIDALAVAGSAYFVIWFYQLLLTKQNVPIIYFGFAHAALMGWEIIVSANFGLLEKIFGTEKYLKFTAFITGMTFLLVAMFPNIFTVIIFMFFAGGFGLTRLTYIIGHINRFIPSEDRATILSTISLFRRFSLVILNPFAGFLADRSLPVALFTLGLISLLPLIYNKKYGPKV